MGCLSNPLNSNEMHPFQTVLRFLPPSMLALPSPDHWPTAHAARSPPHGPQATPPGAPPLGSSSLGSACLYVDEFEVVVHDEVLREQMVVAIHLREGQTPSHIPTQALPQRAVPALDMRRLPATLIDSLMTTRLKDLRIGRPRCSSRSADSPLEYA